MFQYINTDIIEWKILNIAALTIDSKGNNVDVIQRLKDIKSRYGESSEQYQTACNIVCLIGLTNKESLKG